MVSAHLFCPHLHPYLEGVIKGKDMRLESSSGQSRSRSMAESIRKDRPVIIEK